MLPDQTIVFMRGLPGSGKSTLAAKVAAELGAEVFSTDEFFVGVDGVYRFDASQLKQAHTWNQARVRKALNAGRNVVVDNTNIRRWEMNAYLDMCEIGVRIREETPTTSWAWDVDECCRRNTHGVPHEVIRRMRDNFEW